jgi:hypothetical protein
MVETGPARGAGTDAAVALELFGSAAAAGAAAAAHGHRADTAAPALGTLRAAGSALHGQGADGGAAPPRVGPVRLDRAGALERGARDAFEAAGSDVGPPSKLVVRSDGRGARGRWQLRGVEVQQLAAPGGRVVRTTYFPAGDRWVHGPARGGVH